MSPTPDTTPSTWRRVTSGDWVASALEVVLLIVILAVGLTGLLEGLDAFLDDTLTTQVALDDQKVAAVASAGHEVQPDGATLTISDPSFAERVAVAAPPILEALVVGAAATLVLGVVRSLRRGDPFTRANAEALSHAAVVAVVGGVIVVLASIVGPVVVDRGIPDDLPVRLAVTGSSTSLYAGLLLAAVAQVFRRGCALRDELEGVV